jgi:hypothetical protein
MEATRVFLPKKGYVQKSCVVEEDAKRYTPSSSKLKIPKSP